MSSRNQSVGPKDSAGSQASSPPRANGKSTPARRDDSVELKNIRAEDDLKAQVPIEEDIMQLARLGEIGAIQKLFEIGKFDARYADEEGITPLHVRLYPTALICQLDMTSTNIIHPLRYLSCIVGKCQDDPD